MPCGGLSRGELATSIALKDWWPASKEQTVNSRKVLLIMVALVCSFTITALVLHLTVMPYGYTPYRFFPQDRDGMHDYYIYRFPSGKGASVDIRRFSDRTTVYNVANIVFDEESFSTYRADGETVRLSSPLAVWHFIRERAK